MFHKLAVLSVAALAAVVVADDGHCNTGPVQCCQTVQDAHSSAISALLTTFGIDVNSVTGLVGANCSPITGVGIGGSGCAATPVCCEDNSFHGAINIGCTPINVGL